MSLLHRFLATGAPAPQTYVDDVFVSYTRTGTGASATVTTGINLSAKGGLVWTKGRGSATAHKFTDTVRGIQKALSSNLDAAESTDLNGLTAFGTTGHTLGSDAAYNGNGVTFVDWVFAKAPKFFDVVTYAGNSTNRTIAHNLGSVPGMIIIKCLDGAPTDWQVYHRSLANTEYMVLNSAAAKATGTTRWNSTTPTASVFSLGTDTTVNASGFTYVAYVFAHDTSATGLIQCGSFTTDATGASTSDINLGWEPQYVLVKTSSSVGQWHITDASRGMLAKSTAANSQLLQAESNTAESAGSSVHITATGFNVASGWYASSTAIYLAIRRPNKPPTLGTQVYNAIARTGTGAAATVTGVGFAPDLAWGGTRTPLNWGNGIMDRLRGINAGLAPMSTNAETTGTTSVTAFDMNGVSLGTDTNTFTFNQSGNTYINWFFKRAPGVFDEVCYTGTGANTTQAHNLVVAPELWIIKGRSGATAWRVGSTLLAATEFLVLNDTAAKATDATSWNSTYPTSSVFSLGTQANVNTSTATYVAYLFATKAGISKVGSYTGNGSSQTINAGFTTGARWVMIKRTDSTGDWKVIDSTRGLVAASDPTLALNSTAAEVTGTDCVDPDNSGFIVNQEATNNLNVNGGTYIYLSFS